jgi:hypothetical protein
VSVLSYRMFSRGMCSRSALLLQIREVPVPKYCDRQVLVEKVVKEIIEVPVRVPEPYEVEKLVEVERVTEKLVLVTSQQVKVKALLTFLPIAHLRLSLAKYTTVSVSNRHLLRWIER